MTAGRVRERGADDEQDGGESHGHASMFAAVPDGPLRNPFPQGMATTLTWLGHAAFRIDTPGGKRIYVDPFLNGNPKCPRAELEPERVDAIFITHGHGDHVGDTVALAEKFGCPVVAPGRAARLARGQGVEMTWLEVRTRAAPSTSTGSR